MNIKKNHIFVSIASYRDDLCNQTIDSLYSNAAFPNNIFLGICQQNDHSTDPDCLNSKYLNNPNIKIIRLPYTLAKGPTFARALCSTLWNYEEYFFQIDSHLLFVKNWDTLAINMIKRIKSEGLSTKPILSHYTRDISDYYNYNQNDPTDMYSVSTICKSFFNDRGMLSFYGAEIINTNNNLYKNPYIAGGFIFTEYSFLFDVPFDHKLNNIFVGEEILLSIRSFTSGYDVFTPSQNICFHYYTRSGSHRPNLNNDHVAFNKIKLLLKLDNTTSNDVDGILGLGKHRTLNDFYSFAKINLNDKTVHSNFCKTDNTATPEEIKNSNKIINNSSNCFLQ